MTQAERGMVFATGMAVVGILIGIVMAVIGTGRAMVAGNRFKDTCVVSGVVP